MDELAWTNYADGMHVSTTKSSKPRPLILTALVLLFLLTCYVGAYFINLDYGLVIYVDGTSGEIQPSYVVAQEASEIVFWPVFKVHQRVDSERFQFDPCDPFGFADFRDKWW